MLLERWIFAIDACRTSWHRFSWLRWLNCYMHMFSYGNEMVVSAANTTPVCGYVCAARLQQLLLVLEQHKTCCWQHCQAGQHHAHEEPLLRCLFACACGTY
jgi:hypothetical protein